MMKWKTIEAEVKGVYKVVKTAPDFCFPFPNKHRIVKAGQLVSVFFKRDYVETQVNSP